MRPRRVSVLVAAVVAILAACSSAATPIASPSPARSPSASSSAALSAAGAPLTVFAAASLSGVMADVKAAYEAAVSGATLTVSTDSSAALATQIQQGAPADVFLSADTKNPQTLADAGLTDAAPLTFTKNVLTIVVPSGNPAGLQRPADLARSGVKVIAAGDDVPITRYANQLVANLAGLSGYPSDFIARYEANVVSKEDNVKAVIAKIELGEGDAGIVYVTDAVASTKVDQIAVPAEANVPASYAGVVVKPSAHLDAARAFLAWMAGPDGQAILARYGFLPPS